MSALVSVKTGVFEPLTSVEPPTEVAVEIWYVPPCCVPVEPETKRSIAGCKKYPLYLLNSLI